MIGLVGIFRLVLTAVLSLVLLLLVLLLFVGVLFTFVGVLSWIINLASSAQSCSECGFCGFLAQFVAPALWRRAEASFG